MTKRNYSTFHSLVQKVASSRPGSWFFSRTLHHFDRGFLKLTKGSKSLTSVLSGAPLVMLTTTGARSGLPRTLPLLCIREHKTDDTFALIASNWGQKHHPAWYYNLRANPSAMCAIKGHVREYLGHEAESEEYQAYWQCAMDTYIGFPTYQKRAGARTIPIIVMTPA